MLQRSLSNWHYFRLAGALFFLACLSILAAAPPSSANEETIVIKGSDTMLILNRELAAEYNKLHPEVQFDVEGLGSETGIKALLDGTTHIAASSRSIKEKELESLIEKTGQPPAEIIVAMDGIGVYVHYSNPVTQLTVDQVRGILCGEIANWRDVGGLNRQIHIYNRDKQSGTRAFMEKNVLEGKAFSDLAREVSSTALLVSAVARNQKAIGYGGIAYAEGTRILRLSKERLQPGVWPSRENVSGGQYPLSRPLYYYLNPEAINDTVKAYVDWVLSKRGQEVVDFVGYFPAPTPRPAEAPTACSSEPTPTPIPMREPVVVTPQNMLQHGIDLKVELSEMTATEKSEQAMVTLQFGPKATSVERLQKIALRIAEEAEIPLTLRSDLSVQFALRKGLIDATIIRFTEEGAPEDGEIYVVPLEAFCGQE